MSSIIHSRIDFINIPVEFAELEVVDDGADPGQLGGGHGARVLDFEHRRAADQLADAELDGGQGGDAGLEADQAQLSWSSASAGARWRMWVRPAMNVDGSRTGVASMSRSQATSSSAPAGVMR